MLLLSRPRRCGVIGGYGESISLRYSIGLRRSCRPGMMKGKTMATQTRFRSRPYTDADLHAITDLLNACDAADMMDDNYAPEDLQTEFDDPDLDKSKDLRLWEESDGSLAGFGQLWLRPAES